MPTTTTTTTTPIPETILQMASELDLDTLLECPITSHTTIRFICSVRKDLLEAPPGPPPGPNLLEAERVLSRLYHHLGHDRRELAFRRGDRSRPGQ